MLAACTVVLGHLCVPPAYLPVTEVRGTIWVLKDSKGKTIAPDQADIQRLGVHILALSSDNIISAPASLKKTCSEDTCVVYSKVCTSTPLSCTYRYAPESESRNGEIVLETAAIGATSVSALSSAEHALVVTVGKDENAVQIPFSKMTTTSPSE